jgi:hypothetical protein
MDGMVMAMAHWGAEEERLEERLVEVEEELLVLQLVVPMADVQEHCGQPARRLMAGLQVEGEAELALLLEGAQMEGEGVAPLD